MPPDLRVRAMTPHGDSRLIDDPPGTTERLAKFNVKPTDLIPGFRVTYREVANICQLMQDNGWAGGIGLDEAVEAFVGNSHD